jgi:hypothetical protein
MLVVAFQEVADGEAEVATWVFSRGSQREYLGVVKSLKGAEVVLSCSVGVNGRGKGRWWSDPCKNLVDSRNLTYSVRDHWIENKEIYLYFQF